MDRPRLHAQERLDHIDAAHAMEDFAPELHKEHVLRYHYMDRIGGRVLDGFRITNLNTPANGDFTVVTGVAIDRDGQLVLDDESYTKSKTYHLEPNNTYYISILFRLDDTEVDARAFMDPTYNNGNDPSGDPRPNGREFTLSVPTRQHPTWEIRSNTVAFNYLGDPTSGGPAGTRTLEFPLATLTTNAGGVITGVTVESARSTILSIDDIAADWVILNTVRQFVVGNNVQVANPVTGATAGPYPIADIDFENNSIRCTGINASGAQIGWALQDTGAATDLVLNTAQDSSLRPFAQRDSNNFNEGLALLQDPDAPAWTSASFDNVIVAQGTARTPEFLKDNGSFQQAVQSVLREMKYGIGAISAGNRWADSRLSGTLGEVYDARSDQAGSNIRIAQTTLQRKVQANAYALTTVGDGVNTFGDWNGAAEFQTLINMMSNHEIAGTRTFSGKILIKAGTYDLTAWASPKRIPSGVIFEGMNRDAVILTNAPVFQLNQGAAAFAPHDIVFRNMTVTTRALVGGGDTGRSRWIWINNENATDILVDNCHIAAGGFENGTGTHFYAIEVDGGGVLDKVTDFHIEDCLFDMQEGGGGFHAGDDTTGIQAIHSKFNWYLMGLSDTVRGIWIESDSASEILLDRCLFWGAPSSPSGAPVYSQCALSSIAASSDDFIVRNCWFNAAPFANVASTVPRLAKVAIEDWYGLTIGTVGVAVHVEGCVFEALEIGCEVSSGGAEIKDCTFKDCAVGVWDTTAEEGAAGPITHYIRDNHFINCAHMTGATADQRACVGIVVAGVNNANHPTDVIIQGNTFEGQAVGIYGEGNVYGALENAIGDLNISGNKFKYVLSSAIYFENGYTEDATNGVDNHWGILDFLVKHNEFVNCCYDPAATNFSASTYGLISGFTSNGILIKGAGQTWDVSGNTFTDCYDTSGTASATNIGIYNSNRLETFKFSNNKMFDCYPKTTGTTYSYVNIGVGCRYPPLTTSPTWKYIEIDIQGNEFFNHEVGDNGYNPALMAVPVTNGIYFYPFYRWGPAAGNDYISGFVLKGHICNNQFNLMNATYGIAVHPLDGAGNNSLKIGDIDFSHNRFKNRVDSDFGLGSCTFFRGYCFGSAGIDNNPATSFGVQQTGDGLTVIGNKFRMYVTEANALYNLNAAVQYGIYLYSYPGKLIMDDNDFTQCCAYITSTTIAGNDQGDFDIQFDIHIDGNTWDINNADFGSVVYCLWLMTVLQLPPGADATQRCATHICDNTFKVVDGGAVGPLAQRAIYIAGAFANDLPTTPGNENATVVMHGNELVGCMNEWVGAGAAQWTAMGTNLHVNYSHNQAEVGANSSHWAGGGAPSTIACNGKLVCTGNTNDTGIIGSGALPGALPTGDGM